MASLNKVMIMGRLGADPELRYTSSQTPVATLSVATSEFRQKDGQKQEITEWHRVIVWSKSAENCSRYLRKGSPLFVEGRLQTRSWEDRSGQKRYTTEIHANQVQFLSAGPSQPSRDSIGGSEGVSSQGGYQEPSSGGMGGSFTPPSFPQQDSNPHEASGSSMGGIEDIPF